MSAFDISCKRWAPPTPCGIGEQLYLVDTPCLIVDLDKLEENLHRLQKIMNDNFQHIAVRPHAKAHKCPEIAKLQIAYGAAGVCCQTLSEAEAMVYGGQIPDVLISNQVIGKSKLSRVAELAKHSKISICVDNCENVTDISEVAQKLGVTIDCVVEVNVGQNRCGVETGEAAADLAEHITKLANIRFKGLQCYQGANQHIRKYSDRMAAVDKVVEKTMQAVEAVKARGVQCDYVTGGGTGTFTFEASSGIFTEVQPGSYIFMDVDYGRNFLDGDRPFSESFEQSLLIVATIQSVSTFDRCVVDAGMKAVSLDSGEPLILNQPGITYTCAGDEHGILTPRTNYKVGDRVLLVPGHCDPTVNLYDWLVGVRKEKVETLWPVLGRGPGV